MANQFLAANLIPRWGGSESPNQKIADIQDYLFKLREGLAYELQNLDSKNFSSVFSKEQSEVIQTAIAGNLNAMEQTIQAMQEVLKLVKLEGDVLTIGAEEKTVALIGTVTVNGREV